MTLPSTTKLREATAHIFGDDVAWESLERNERLEIAKLVSVNELDSSIMEVDRTLTQIYQAMPE